MTGRIPKSFIDHLVTRADIVSVVGRRVVLKKAGREYKACCPFHQEKSPSFHVNPQKSFYHCFGCGAHGDALTFIMEYEHQSFVDAVETLAMEMGLSVPREVESSPAQAEQMQVVRQVRVTALEALTAAGRWFQSNLREHAHKQQAIGYLQQRGLQGEIARDFAIGFAPNDRQGLQQAHPNIALEVLDSVGLVTERDGQWIDRFRNRIMFPIRNLKGQVVGFGGRIMQPSEHAPKYPNSPETEFFHKGQMLYGLYEVLKASRQIHQILVVEGYMDVVALAQAGIRNAVATLGTATTDEHIDLLFRYAQEVVFAFDGDAAGRKAAWKALTLILPKLGGEQSVQFLFLPDGEDPDSWVRAIGADAFRQHLASAMSPAHCLIDGLTMQTQLSWTKTDDVRRLLAMVQPLLTSVANLSVQYGLVQEIAQASQMQEWQIEKMLGIRTGMAVHRRAGTQTRRADPSMQWGQAKTLAMRLFELLCVYPQLPTLYPVSDIALVAGLPQEGVGALVKFLHDPSTASDVATQGMQVMIDESSAAQEWQDGWQSLICQSLQYQRDVLLKKMDVVAISSVEADQVRQLSERLRVECHRRGS